MEILNLMRQQLYDFSGKEAEQIMNKNPEPSPDIPDIDVSVHNQAFVQRTVTENVCQKTA